MNIFDYDTTKLTFEQIVEFCKQGIPEGIEIDYKMDFPTKSLAKIIASFSNTRGGFLIIGVEEDKTTGLPKEYLGVDDNAQLVEQIYQNSESVTPFPNLIVRKTNSVNGKVFIVVNVLEGEMPPYFIHNTSNVWVRTGNISTPIELTNPAHLDFLYKKRENAESLRKIYIKRCAEVNEACLKKEEKERQRLIAGAIQKGDGSEKNYYKQKLGANSTFSETYLMPYYLGSFIAKPAELKSKLMDIRSGTHRFPDLNMDSIPEGLAHSTHGYTGYVETQQIYSNGLLYSNRDVLNVDQDGMRNVYILYIAGNVFDVFKAGKNLYTKYNFNGIVVCKITFNNLKDIWLKEIGGNGFFTGRNDHENFMENYEWEKVFSTHLFDDETTFKNLFTDVLREIYWSLGYPELNTALIDKFIKESDMSFK